MKSRIFVSIALLVFVFVFISFKSNNNSFVPPGTVKVNDKLYWDETEVTNLHWLEYVYWNKKHFGEQSEQYKKSLSDTTVWDNMQPEQSIYHNHPAFNNYHVVGITYEQAKDYCKWRTERVKETLAILKKTAEINFNYRLPAKEEWESVANAGYDEKQLKIINSKRFSDCHLNNLKIYAATIVETEKKYNPKATITAPAKSFFPNRFGIYNLIGNVAEMTATKEISKGGGWNDLKDEVTVEKDFVYSGATPWTGFRCVCEVSQIQ
jgi:formylglycine-generating enzyme required for sulfatase activity